jgi:ABC-2 type transport system permease protein
VIIVRLLALFGASVSLSLRRILAFRANLLFQLFTTATGLAAGLVALTIVYTHTSSLVGWTLGETIVLLGTYQILSGVLATFIEPNVQWFAGQVRNGQLDDILLKPVPSLFLVSLGSCAPLGLTGVALGCLVVGGGLHEIGVVPNLWGVVSWLVTISIGVILTWASRVLLAIMALWAPALELDVVYTALWQFGRYPITLYRQPFRFVLTYIVPVAFIATIPARALIEGAHPLQLLVSGAIGGAAIGFVLLVWRVGLRRYTSATS